MAEITSSKASSESRENNWRHPILLVGPVILLIALMTWNLKILLLTAGVELFSTSFHVANHHPGKRLGYIEVRILALTLVGAVIIWVKLNGW